MLHFIIHNQSLRSFTVGVGGGHRGTIKKGLGTECERIGTFRGFGTERVRLRTFKKSQKLFFFFTQKEHLPALKF